MNDYLIELDHQERLDDARRQGDWLRLLNVGRAERCSPLGAFLSTIAGGAGRLVERSWHAVRSALTGSSQPSEQCY